MDNEILDKIDEIIDMLENDDYRFYLYKNNKFLIIDKGKNIDFTAKLGNNNLIYRDNIKEITYMFSKKYLDKKTSVQQIIIEDKNGKYCYCFLEKGNMVELIRVLRKDEEGSFVCENNNVISKNNNEILEYANEIFEVVDDFEYDILETDMEDNISNMESNNGDRYQFEEYTMDDNIDEYEDEDSKYKDSKYKDGKYEDGECEDEEYEDGEYEDEDYEDDEYEYEYNQIEENSTSQLSDQFDKNKISDYETYIAQEQSKNDTDYSNEYEEALLEFSNDYKLVINGKEVDGIAKMRIIADCEVIIEQKYFESRLMNEGVQNLKMVLEAKNKEEYDR